MGKMKATLEKIIGRPEPTNNFRDHVTIQYSDQTKCRICGKVWDTNDYDPPNCIPK